MQLVKPMFNVFGEIRTLGSPIVAVENAILTLIDSRKSSLFKKNEKGKISRSVAERQQFAKSRQGKPHDVSLYPYPSIRLQLTAISETQRRPF